jgi:hypothetical protein
MKNRGLPDESHSDILWNGEAGVATLWASFISTSPNAEPRTTSAGIAE